MSLRLVRSSLIGAAVAAGVAFAPPGAGAAATVTLSTSSSTIWVGGTFSATVTSDTSGTIGIYQLRTASKQGGAGRCFLQQGFVDGYVRSRPALTQVAITAGKPLTIKLTGSRFDFFDGNLLDGIARFDGPDGCYDPPTQFTRVGAFLNAENGYDTGHAVRPLTRVL